VINRRQFLQSAGWALAASPVVGILGCTQKLAAEYVIIGSGPAGIALADTLAQAGKQVLVLEGGTRQTDTALQSMHDVEAGQWGLPYNLGWATQRVLGGTTNLWQSHSPRPLEEELASQTLRGFGEDWPLTLNTLTPWLASSERWLHVRPAQPELNPSLPKNPYIDTSTALSELLSGKGYTHLEAGAYGMVSGEGADALRLLDDGEIDRVAALNTVAVRPGTIARRIRMTGERAVGVECADLKGNAFFVEAGTVIVCGGGIQTPRLLWNSGVGNHSDWLGAGFMEHPGMQIYGHRAAPLLPPGVPETHIHVRDMLYDPAHNGLGGTLLHVGLKPGAPNREYTMVEVLFEQAPDRRNRILPGNKKDALGDPIPRIDYRLTELDLATIQRGQQLQHTLAEHIGSVDNTSPLRTGSHHLLGATRMAANPANGVVDTDLRVWGTDNLYVASSSAFPTGLTVPPTLIIVALAQRLAQHLTNTPRPI
jgi:choline dehydrogenase-like flavoprotein